MKICNLLQTDLEGSGCAPGLTCYPTADMQRCVKPCQDDEGCVALPGPARTCGQPVGEWGLRYCE
ncbi:MAG: hypothetical protein H0U74_04095 [Bradymonadaceae bacterium]|nr:hypothetical protein [Lujinxingiaceae bacterium]